MFTFIERHHDMMLRYCTGLPVFWTMPEPNLNLTALSAAIKEAFK